MPDQQAGTTLVRSAQPLDFTDGDTFKRFTIVDSYVTIYSHIVPLIRRADVAEVDDQGWTYHATVVTQTAGSFDVNVTVLMMGEAPINDEYPNETVQFSYSLQ